MPRRSSVEKPVEDPNVEKRVTRGSVRKSEGGSGPPAVATPDKQKETSKSKNQSPAKTSTTPGKRGRPSKRSIASTEEDDKNTEVAEKTENQTSADIENDVEDTNNHDAQSDKNSKEGGVVSHANETAPEESDAGGKKRLADDESEGPSAKKARSEEEPVKEAEKAHSEETAVVEAKSVAEKMETKEESATDNSETSAAAADVPETGDAVKQSNDGSGDIPDVCSKPIPSESAAVTATTEEVIKENGCHEAENKLVASDAC